MSLFGGRSSREEGLAERVSELEAAVEKLRYREPVLYVLGHPHDGSVDATHDAKVVSWNPPEDYRIPCQQIPLSAFLMNLADVCGVSVELVPQSGAYIQFRKPGDAS